MSRRGYRIPITLFGIALLIRLLYVLNEPAPLHSDMEDYATCAGNLLAGKGLIKSEEYQAYRPPLYPLLLAGQFRLVGGYPAHAAAGLLLARIVQAVLGATVAPTIYLLVLSAKTNGIFPAGGRDPRTFTAVLATRAAGAPLFKLCGLVAP